MRERRWLLCFLVAMCCTLSTWALPSQDKTVTLNLRNVSVETVLDAVKKADRSEYVVQFTNV